ncbi:YmaF family protein [Gorillibacterium timonense]|uniref:YmaF family protein n=1 Tax=Gorillibacterium timonense TaxID=1689269 RepID=UPI00071E39F6|nr:YmaF family protein [Gorillibacterium timonense]
MKIRVSGIVTNSGKEEDSHSHRLQITSWGGVPVHVHAFGGVTSVEDGHAHEYGSLTAPAPTGVPHVHEYRTVTSLDNGHTHLITGTTGPAIDLLGGGHYHLFEGYTTINGRYPHTHKYCGRTGL